MFIRGHVDHGSLVACESVTVWRLVSRMCKQVALCMGLHARLGEDANCWIRILDESLVMMVLPPPPPPWLCLGGAVVEGFSPDAVARATRPDSTVCSFFLLLFWFIWAWVNTRPSPKKVAWSGVRQQGVARAGSWRH